MKHEYQFFSGNFIQKQLKTTVSQSLAIAKDKNIVAKEAGNKNQPSPYSVSKPKE
jgi:hypothetical protein